MSSYSRIVLLFVLLVTSIGCANQSYAFKKQIDPQEDLYIMLALDSEKNLDFKNSLKYYQKLYEKSPTKTYLKKTILYAFKAKQYETAETLSLKAIEKFKKDEEFFTHEYILALTFQKKYQKALQKAKELLTKYKNPASYELIANIYYNQKDYKNALPYYESAYAGNKNEDTLVKLTNILYTYLEQKDTALAYLETYVQQNRCVPKICNKLMLIYQEQGNIEGMLSILTRMYNKYKFTPGLEETTRFIQNLIISLLEKKDIKKAIKFLEDTGVDQAKLINLYYQDRQLKKALKLTKKIYKQTKNPELLGKIAMYRFELANDKRKVMKNVIANFELALSSGINNASYQNYYGYLLIDFDIDVKKGIDLVKQALRTAPNNIAYLDSLAWGYYKLGFCDDAIDLMSKVVQTTGTNDQEISIHWNRIKDCKKDKKQK
jgi:tetratricopeptide (TPR) repeat protein